MGQTSSKITAQDKAVLDLKLQRDKLKQYQKRIQTVLEREHSVAKQCLAKGDKRRSLLALRKKKYQEQLLSKTDSQLQTLEQLTESIEFALVQKDVMYGLQQGNQVLKTLNAEMSMEKVEKILDESAEGIAYQNEISDMLATNISNADELEVQEEFEKLEQEAAAAAANMAPDTVPNLPSVPETIPERTRAYEEHEIDQTQKSQKSQSESGPERQPVLA